jgi:hypothetical protein
MFGRWKRRYEVLVGDRDDWKQLAGNRLKGLQEAIDKTVSLRRQLREAKARLAAADFPLEAERAENERLRARLKTTQAGLDHATHCYEQCEADRQALAKERDEWRDVAESASTVTARVFALCRGFITDLSRLKEIADAPSEPDPADDRPGTGCQARCPRAVPRDDFDAPGLQPDADPDHAAVQGDAPDFIRFPGFADPDTDPDAA